MIYKDQIQDILNLLSANKTYGNSLKTEDNGDIDVPQDTSKEKPAKSMYVQKADALSELAMVTILDIIGTDDKFENVAIKQFNLNRADNTKTLIKIIEKGASGFSDEQDKTIRAHAILSTIDLKLKEKEISNVIASLLEKAQPAYIHKIALYTLGELDAKNNIKEIVAIFYHWSISDAAKHKNNIITALRALGKLKAKSALPYIKKAAEHFEDDVELQKEASETLSKIGGVAKEELKEHKDRIQDILNLLSEADDQYEEYRLENIAGMHKEQMLEIFSLIDETKKQKQYSPYAICDKLRPPKSSEENYKRCKAKVAAQYGKKESIDEAPIYDEADLEYVKTLLGKGTDPKRIISVMRKEKGWDEAFAYDLLLTAALIIINEKGYIKVSDQQLIASSESKEDLNTYLNKILEEIEHFFKSVK